MSGLRGPDSPEDHFRFCLCIQRLFVSNESRVPFGPSLSQWQIPVGWMKIHFHVEIYNRILTGDTAVKEHIFCLVFVQIKVK